ncbi:hypothetical protein AB833_13825 [Chromatiales bacterium (ex Bugula neritina AB1)]|nr:hypothetical protein AB833_13825 [Chromatiales bacterium (ex Bugula neritina AB1)]
MHRKHAAILDADPDYHIFADKYDAETAHLRLIGGFDPEIEEFVSRVEEMYVDAQAYQKKAEVGTK